jgi:uncharacterized protein YciI
MKHLLTILIGMLTIMTLGFTTQPEQQRISRDYVFVFITTGPVTDLSDEERSKAFAGHFGNMRRLADEGKLLIAGPFGDPKSDPNHRGLFVFDETDPKAGQALAETDPTVDMGVFEMTSHTLTTDEPLLDLLQLDKEAAEKLGEDAPPGSNARAYMLATAPFDEALFEKVGKSDGVLVAAKIHGSGPEDSDEILLWLDAEDEEAAKELLPEDCEWTLHGWYGSMSLVLM